MKLIQVVEGIWTVPSPLTVLGIIQLNTRMTIIRLECGKLWIHSPIPWSEELDSKIRSIGDIEYIIAPSCFHHMFVGPWKEHHPKALICGPNGLKKKRSANLGSIILDCNLRMLEFMIFELNIRFSVNFPPMGLILRSQSGQKKSKR